MFKVPYTSFLNNQESKKRVMFALEGLLDKGMYILGPEVASFEQEFAKYCEVPYAIGVSNGTCALHLALNSMGIKKGDEIITAPNSFIASASAIALAGGVPVFVDIADDGNIDPGKIEAAITPRTKGILPVHLTGRPAKMTQILEIAKSKNLYVVEDAAQAVGAKLNGKMVGSFGDAGCFSMHPLKNLHAYGDAGMVTYSDPAKQEYLRKARNHGLLDREQCDFWSCNARLDEIQASLLRLQLQDLERNTEAKRKLALRYNNLLPKELTLPIEGPGEYCVYQTYVIRTQRRDELQKYLRDNGVEALTHYKTAIFDQPAAKYLNYSEADFPETMNYVNRVISLPLYPDMAEEAQDFVIELCHQFFKK